ncbi:unnamed protein product [Calypogeia fissa]
MSRLSENDDAKEPTEIDIEDLSESKEAALHTILSSNFMD